MNASETKWVERVAAILAEPEPMWCPIREHYCRCNPRCEDAYAAEPLLCECCGAEGATVRRRSPGTCSACQARIDSGSADAEDGRGAGEMYAAMTRGER